MHCLVVKLRRWEGVDTTVALKLPGRSAADPSYNKMWYIVAKLAYWPKPATIARDSQWLPKDIAALPLSHSLFTL